MYIQIVILVFALYFLYKEFSKRPNNFPPGPRKYPFIGTITKSTGGDVFKELGEQYGSLTGLFFGPQKVVVANGWEIIKEILFRDEFQDRPQTAIDYDHASKPILGNMGVMFANGELWKDQRRFSLRNLRDFGFGKSSLEDLIHEEIQDTISHVIQDLKSSLSSVYEEAEKIFTVPVINILWAVVAGERYSRNDEKFKDLLKKLNDSFRSGENLSLLALFSKMPFLRHFPIFNKMVDALKLGRTSVLKLLRESIKEHEDTFNEDNPRDFIDVYLKETKIANQNNGNSHYSEYQLAMLLADLFAAGAESTSNSLAFAIMYMINNPKIQEKVHAEIDSVIGKDRLPVYADTLKMPYTQAVLAELLRIANIAPLAVPHFTTMDAKLSGYNIPKDTVVFVNLYSVSMDESYWGDAKNFRPERFLNKSGEYVKNERNIPFGIGKRACLGESLARYNYFLFFVAMLQKFRFEQAGDEKPSEEPLKGFTNSPKPFKAKITERF